MSDEGRRQTSLNIYANLSLSLGDRRPWCKRSIYKRICMYFFFLNSPALSRWGALVRPLWTIARDNIVVPPGTVWSAARGAPSCFPYPRGDRARSTEALDCLIWGERWLSRCPPPPPPLTPLIINFDSFFCARCSCSRKKTHKHKHTHVCVRALIYISRADPRAPNWFTLRKSANTRLRELRNPDRASSSS